MRKPLIGLTPAHDLKEGDVKARPTYLKALEAAGAIPVVMPLDVSKDDLKQLADDLDGFLFTGGPDIHPFLFREETHEGCGNVSPKRDRMELDLLPLVMELKKPVLGICRGIQVLNAALGGTLWQDIPSQVKRDFPLSHSQPFAYDMPCHRVTLREGSLLADISKNAEIYVNSMHHQAVKDLGMELVAAGYSSDGLIEAVEMNDYPFFIGVQWHPEYLWQNHDEAFRLFQAFSKASQRAR